MRFLPVLYVALALNLRASIVVELLNSQTNSELITFSFAKNGVQIALVTVEGNNTPVFKDLGTAWDDGDHLTVQEYLAHYTNADLTVGKWVEAKGEGCEAGSFSLSKDFHDGLLPVIYEGGTNSPRALGQCDNTSNPVLSDPDQFTIGGIPYLIAVAFQAFTNIKPALMAGGVVVLAIIVGNLALQAVFTSDKNNTEGENLDEDDDDDY